ncbi:MAG: hypothetical protein K8S97_06095 [Anaerolineae bacterium]|nr:hypothetical protein [Anaerolineae bacterium]
MLKQWFKSRIRDPIAGQQKERGQGLTEYAMVLVLVALVVIVILVLFGEEVQNQYCEVVLSLQADAPAGMCENVEMTCRVDTTSPLRVRALITVPDGDGVDHVDFSVDGTFRNREFHRHYCLVRGNGPCSPAYLSSGQHRITAVAVLDSGVTGRCSVVVNVP